MSKRGKSTRVTLNLGNMTPEEAAVATAVLEKLFGRSVAEKPRARKRKRKRNRPAQPRKSWMTPEEAAEAKAFCLFRLSENWRPAPGTGRSGSVWADALADIICGLEADASAQEAAAAAWIDEQGPFARLTTIQAVRACSGFLEEEAAARTVGRLWPRVIDRDEEVLRTQYPNHWTVIV